MISGNVSEPLNQIQKENLKHLEHIQNYVVLEHHHQRGQVSHHGPGPGGQEEVNSVIFFQKINSPDLVQHGQCISSWKNQF